MIKVMREVLGTLLTAFCLVFPTGVLAVMFLFAWKHMY